MRDGITQKVAWRRRGVRRPYVGTLDADEGGIRLSGRDPVSGVEVTLSIPLAEVQSVHVARPGEELLAGERCVVLDLAESEAIFLREVGQGSLHIHVLARTLGALTHASGPLLVQGGVR